MRGSVAEDAVVVNVSGTARHCAGNCLVLQSSGTETRFLGENGFLRYRLLQGAQAMAEAKVTAMFTAPGVVDFGVGAANGAGQRAKELGAGRAFIVTDRGVCNAGLLARLTSALDGAGVAYEVWDAVQPNPTDKDVTAGVEAFRKTDCQVVVALGGGSPLDAAKGIALMATHGGKIQDYDAAVRGWEKVKPTIPPLIAIPTTAGTGSEMSAAAIITDTSRNVKMIVASPFLKPRVALLDP
ncbi:MAG: iron-containing alcohol dehydrogenase, partial [Planctomycetes bacterium]|nr:iron-containing alcohol dehydrogenase [Planctomycetota bacterium]